MSRLPWLVVAVAALALLGFLFWYTPAQREAAQVRAPAPPAERAAADPSPMRPEAAAPAEAPRPGVTRSAPPILDAGPPEEKGPFVVELGRHTVYLNDPVERRVMRFTLKLTVGNAVAAKEVRLRREELVRMAFFLGSHRVAEGALGEGGRDRYGDDLLDRYRNVIRTGSLDALELVDYEVIPSSKLPPRRP